MKVKTAAPRVIDFESHLTNQMMRSPRCVPKYPGIRNFLIKSLMSEWDAVRHALRERFVREDKTNLRQKLEKRQKEEGITAAVDAYLASHTWAPYEPFPKFKHVTKDNLIHILVDKKNIQLLLGTTPFIYGGHIAMNNYGRWQMPSQTPSSADSTLGVPTPPRPYLSVSAPELPLSTPRPPRCPCAQTADAVTSQSQTPRSRARRRCAAAAATCLCTRTVAGCNPTPGPPPS